MAVITESQHPLARIQYWEKEGAHRVYLTQPMGGGVVRDYTWMQTVGEARRIAAYLKAQNYPAGSNIAILSKNCAHWIMADFAIWMAGHVSVPLYPTLNAETVRQILEHSGSKALFVGKLDDWPAMKPGVPAGVHCISYPSSPPNDFPTWDDLVARTAPFKDIAARGLDELATIIYTSGTTGMPKGVMHSFRTIAHSTAPITQRYNVSVDDRLLSHLPLSHVAERWTVEAATLVAGGRIFFAESLETFAADLRRARPTIFGTVPRLWIKFQQGVFSKFPKKKLDRLLKIPVLNRIIRKKILEGLGLDQVRFAGGGAAPLPPAMLNWYRELGLEILELYGMTENFGLSHANAPGDFRPGYVGKPWPGVECRLSEIGEVLVRSPSTMLGYYKEPEKTREVLSEDGWLKTGDVGEVDGQGRLRITGRAKEIFKTSKGKYVAPAPIESKLSQHPAVEACCVAGANQSQPCALLMLSADALKQDRAALTQSLAEHLDKVNVQLDPHEQMEFLAVVKDAWTVEAGFITPTMKVKRNVVEKTYATFVESSYVKKQPVVFQTP
ncbi:MAG: AMP-binding protein [Pseudomonadota bacterium]